MLLPSITLFPKKKYNTPQKPTAKMNPIHSTRVSGMGGMFLLGRDYEHVQIPNGSWIPASFSPKGASVTSSSSEGASVTSSSSEGASVTISSSEGASVTTSELSLVSSVSSAASCNR